VRAVGATRKYVKDFLLERLLVKRWRCVRGRREKAVSAPTAPDEDRGSYATADDSM
jgi:hypothetical protein